MKKLIIKDCTLHNAYYNNGEAKTVFWPDGVDSAYLHFKLESNSDENSKAVPYKITYEYIELNVGTKMNIEVVNNGFIIKIGSDTKITESDYDLKKMLDAAISSSHKESIDYDADEHTFDNLEAMTAEIENELRS